MITDAKYMGGYSILVRFDDGVERLADFTDFMFTSSLPVVKKYRNVDLFKQFYINSWGLCWGDNEFDINPVDIYNGKFDANGQSVDGECIACDDDSKYNCH